MSIWVSKGLGGGVRIGMRLGGRRRKHSGCLLTVILLIAVTFVFAVQVFGRLELSPDQCVKKYGKPIEDRPGTWSTTESRTIPCRTIVWEKEDFRLECMFFVTNNTTNASCQVVRYRALFDEIIDDDKRFLLTKSNGLVSGVPWNTAFVGSKWSLTNGQIFGDQTMNGELFVCTKWFLEMCRAKELEDKKADLGCLVD